MKVLSVSFLSGLDSRVLKLTMLVLMSYYEMSGPVASLQTDWSTG